VAESLIKCPDEGLVWLHPLGMNPFMIIKIKNTTNSYSIPMHPNKKKEIDMWREEVARPVVSPPRTIETRQPSGQLFCGTRIKRLRKKQNANPSVPFLPFHFQTAKQGVL